MTVSVATPRRWLALALVCVAQFKVVPDVSLFVALLVLGIYPWQTGQHGGMQARQRDGAERD